MEKDIYNELRKGDKLCDVIFRINGIDFRAHKLIMCGCSQYFRTLFAGIWSSTEIRVYCIPDVSADMMELVLQYAYTGHPEITVSNVEPLLVTANYLDMQGLLRLCCDFLKHHLCPFNCIGIWRYADAYSCFELRDSAHTFILQHFEEISCSPTHEFLEMSLSELRGILEQDRLNVKDEETVFKAVMTWIEHDLELRSPHIITLLPKVRMGLMTSDFFMDKVWKNQLIRQYKRCRPIMIRSLKIIFNIKKSGLSNMVFSEPESRPRVPNSVLLSIGGWTDRGPSNIIEAYDSRAKSWRVIFCPKETHRAYHNIAFIDCFLYVIGGLDGIDHLNKVCKFNPVTQTWHEVAPMHSRRCYVSVVVLDGCIYAIGGFDGIRRLNTAECYIPSTNQWSYIEPMDEQRSDANATILHGKIYICGGFNGNECLFTAECFNPQTGQWTYIAPMHERRTGVGVITFNNQIYVVGGFNGNERLSSVEVYDPQSNTWRNCSPMLRSRSNFGIAVMDELLYVVGGYNVYGTTSKTEYYDEKTDKWFDMQDSNIRRSALSCCVVSALPNMTDYTSNQGTHMPYNATCPTHYLYLL